MFTDSATDFVLPLQYRHVRLARCVAWLIVGNASSECRAACVVRVAATPPRRIVNTSFLRCASVSVPYNDKQKVVRLPKFDEVAGCGVCLPTLLPGTPQAPRVFIVTTGVKVRVSRRVQVEAMYVEWPIVSA